MSDADAIRAAIEGRLRELADEEQALRAARAKLLGELAPDTSNGGAPPPERELRRPARRRPARARPRRDTQPLAPAALERPLTDDERIAARAAELEAQLAKIAAQRSAPPPAGT